MLLKFFAFINFIGGESGYFQSFVVHELRMDSMIGKMYIHCHTRLQMAFLEDKSAVINSTT